PHLPEAKHRQTYCPSTTPRARVKRFQPSTFDEKQHSFWGKTPQIFRSEVYRVGHDGRLHNDPVWLSDTSTFPKYQEGILFDMLENLIGNARVKIAVWEVQAAHIVSRIVQIPNCLR